jgi:transcriptional regulator with XRE-family HTH domain
VTQGERVKQIRIALNLTTEKFGERLGVQRSAISKIEHDRCSLTDQMTLLICKEFNVNEEWLRTGSGDMFVKIPEEDLYSKAAASVLVEDDAFAMEALKLYYQMSPKAKEAVSNYILQLADLIREHKAKKE